MQAEGEIVQLPTERVAPPRDFRTFFEEEHARLFKTLYFVTGDRTEAADLMQEAFVKLWERWDTIDRIDDPTHTSSRWHSTGTGCVCGPHAGPRGARSHSASFATRSTRSASDTKPFGRSA